MTTNRQAGLRFRSEVLVYLLQQGVVSARDAFASNRLSDLIGGESAYTDIAGIDPWVIDVRTAQTFDLSTSLNDAKRGAARASSEWFVSIQSRRNYPIEDSYCLLPLDLMTRIFKGETPRNTSELVT